METTTPPAFRKPVPPIGAMDAYKAFWQKYAVFTGRDSRPEYWWPVLFNYIISIVLSGFAAYISGFQIINYAFAVATLIPGLALCARRLHDIGKGFGWIFLALIPIVGWIILIVWYCKPGEPGMNRFGANPTEPVE